MELVELPGEILVMQVQPVELREVSLLHLLVVDRRIVDAGVLEGERHGVVPRLHIGRRVHGNARRFLERHTLHVAARHLLADAGKLRIGHRLGRNAIERRAAAQFGCVGQQKRATTKVEQPLGLHAGLHGVVGQAIRLQVVGLPIIHWNEQALPVGDGPQRSDEEQRG